MTQSNLGLNARQRTGAVEFRYLAVGTGAITFNPATSTTLGTESARSAISSTVTVGAMTIYAALFTNAQANGTITEWGIFDAAAAGNMLSYGTFATSVVKTNTSGLVVRITDTLSAA